MDFLKHLFGENGDKPLTYAELEQAINAHNGNEANKENQIKIGNLGKGEYVGRAKHGDLQTRFDSQAEELSKANKLIAELQEAAKGDETLQGKVTEYQNQVAQLQKDLKAALIDSGLQIAFMEAGGQDIKYLMYLAKNGDKALELGEDGKIKGLADLVTSLKTSTPAQFKKPGAGGFKIEENPLPGGDGGGTPSITKEQFSKMGYQSRLKLKQEQPDVYAQLTGKNTK